MKVVVTGAAGFVGSHLVERLLAGGDEVVGVDSFDPFYPRSAKERNLTGASRHPGFSLVEADVCDTEAWLDGGPVAAGGPVDAIVHLAARVNTRASIADPAGYEATNLGGTRCALEFAQRRGIGQFVFGSSSSVYGVNPRVPWREDDFDLAPISPYARSKVSCEQLGLEYAQLHGMRFIALRFFTVYGPRQRPDLAIHKFARCILEGKPIPVFGDGSTRRDYTYVDDIVSGVVSALRYRASPYEVINLGNNHTVSLAELIGALESALGRPAVIDRQPEQPGDVPQTWADISKAAHLLGYRPQTPLADGLRAFADWLANDITSSTPRG